VGERASAVRCAHTAREPCPTSDRRYCYGSHLACGASTGFQGMSLEGGKGRRKLQQATHTVSQGARAYNEKAKSNERSSTSTFWIFATSSLKIPSDSLERNATTCSSCATWRPRQVICHIRHSRRQRLTAIFRSSIELMCLNVSTAAAYPRTVTKRSTARCD